jgi:hypothetical protein
MVIKRSAEIRHVVSKVLIRPFRAVRQNQGGQAQRCGRPPLAGDQSLGSDTIIRNADPSTGAVTAPCGTFPETEKASAFTWQHAAFGA